VPLRSSTPIGKISPELFDLDYGDFLHACWEEKIRTSVPGRNPNIEIHIVGFAKKVVT